MNVIFLGPPGAGKGTIASKIKDKLSLLHLSTGDMLRGEMKAGTELGNMAKSYIEAGQLVPDDVIIGMVENKLKETEGGILFDGFPRTVAQAEALDGITTINAVINLDTTEDVVIERICTRRMCRKCGSVHNTRTLPKGATTCPDCGGELYIRDDDNEDTVKNRFRVYMEQTAPLIEYYEKKGILKTFDANRNSDELASEIGQVLNK